MAMETSSISATSGASVTQSQSSASKTSSDSSFKDEMNKVSSAEKKDTKKEEVKKSDEQKSSEKTDSQKDNSKKSVKDENPSVQSSEDKKLSAELSINEVSRLSFNDVNNMLINDIQAMAETNSVSKIKNWSFSFGDSSKSVLTFSESDAQFFINLTENKDVSIQGLNTQAQNMINSGFDVAEVNHNFKVSQALLEALSQSRQNNQPLRIDFDQNISVILRVNQNGAISANFIPGDKAVEQYLRNNIDILRNTFDENNLPYSDLSYSHSSKDQNKRRREQEQQGE